ncbi:MAG: PTS sugar transporter subunit IIA [Alphaproteobacteria bacterium]|nr:PTS sugar transporter subunit IIA [Alphaproteobacteria bacterium]
MIGIVIITHGKLADEFRSALEHVMGVQSNLETICIYPNDHMAQCKQNILESVQRVNDGTGVIILTDMFGGTPSNLAISVMQPNVIEVIAGVNLPMLIKLARSRHKDNLMDVVLEVQADGRKYINIASRLFKKKYE